jgi:hypothetical protein
MVSADPKRTFAMQVYTLMKSLLSAGVLVHPMRNSLGIKLARA